MIPNYLDKTMKKNLVRQIITEPQVKIRKQFNEHIRI